MDFTLADSNTTLLDFDEFDTPVSTPARAQPVDLDFGLEVAVETSGNGGSGGGGSGNSVFTDMSDEENSDGDDDSHAPVHYSANFVAVDPSEDLEPAMELAVDASGNGGGGGGSGNVVCADMFDDDSGDDDDGSINLWTREDAIRALQVEFWMYHPDRKPGECAHNCENISVGPNHPQYDLYVQILALINLYYDELDRQGGSCLVDDIKRQVKFAWDIFRANASLGTSDYWTGLLPSRARIMLTRFVVSYDDIDGSIAAMLGEMGHIRMLHLDP